MPALASALGRQGRAADAGRPRTRQPGKWLALFLVWAMASGASCPHVLKQYTQPIPRALPEAATLTQIVNVVNDNSNRVQSLSASRATLSMPGMPSLNANINFQRPRSLRLMAHKFIGEELDLGSNDELMWFWVKRGQPPAMLYCRHDQFHSSAARQILPVEPEWLIEAFGLITLNPTEGIEGPFPVGSGRVELRTRAVSDGKPMSRILIIDDSRGVLLEAHLYDANRTLLASAVMSKHTRDPASGVTMPHYVTIKCPAQQFEMSIDLGEVTINQLAGDPSTLFVKPTYTGYNEIDLAQPPPGPLAPTASGPYQLPPAARY
jgi:hypothetical protein